MARYLFQPFQTTKAQGLGIGLHHSKKIVEAHRGRIEVWRARKARGSTFRVMLPATGREWVARTSMDRPKHADEGGPSPRNTTVFLSGERLSASRELKRGLPRLLRSSTSTTRQS